MQLASVRIIVQEIQKMVTFYEKITGRTATWYTPDFAEIKTPSATLAIGSTRTLALFEAGDQIKAGENKTAIIEFFVDDVDREFNRLSGVISDGLIQVPTTMPWGNRSLLFRDPEGNLINFFTPVSASASDRLAGKSV